MLCLSSTQCKISIADWNYRNRAPGMYQKVEQGRKPSASYNVQITRIFLNFHVLLKLCKY